MFDINGQMLQDLFVDLILDRSHGIFLDIGAGNGGQKDKGIGFLSNTFSLEMERDWRGLCIDFDQDYINRAKPIRNSVLICADLMIEDINQILSNNNFPTKSDYLSLDVDNATEHVLDALDFNKYRFKIITYEHNLFQAQDTSDQIHTEEHKKEIVRMYDKARVKFKSLGYRLLFGNVALKGFGFVEDWYVDPSEFDKELLDQLESHDIDCVEVIDKLMRIKCLTHQTYL